LIEAWLPWFLSLIEALFFYLKVIEGSTTLVDLIDWFLEDLIERARSDDRLLKLLTCWLFLRTLWRWLFLRIAVTEAASSASVSGSSFIARLPNQESGMQSFNIKPRE
jgi:hypothetical protein